MDSPAPDLSIRRETHAPRPLETLRHSEEFFHRIYQHAPLGISITDLNGKFLECNPAYCELFGYSEAELKRMNYSSLIHPDDKAAVLAENQQLRAGNLQNLEIESRNIRKDGRILWTRKFISLLRGEPGEPPCVMALVRDTTEHRQLMIDFTQAMVDLTEAKELAEAANVAKSRFLASVSHDLRQPIFALSLYADLLKGRVGPDEASLVSNIRDLVGGLGELLVEVLDLSKLDAGVVEPAIADFSVTELFGQIATSFGPKAAAKGLMLSFRPTGRTARTDPVLFGRLIGNLLSNAIRYTHRGGVLVGCRHRQGKHWVEVWDTGIGFHEDMTTEIFEEFRQIDTAGSHRVKGSGLGLTIVSRTAMMLRLNIRVRSRPGKGSMFAIELPSGSPLRRLPSASPVAPRPLRIGLVEDNAAVFEALVSTLEDDGHQVTAATGRDGLMALLGDDAPDILIADYRLCAGETGLDAIEAVRARFDEDLPVILITGDTDPHLIRQMDRNRITVLHKPVEMKSLRATMAKLTLAKP